MDKSIYTHIEQSSELTQDEKMMITIVLKWYHRLQMVKERLLQCFDDQISYVKLNSIYKTIGHSEYQRLMKSSVLEASREEVLKKIVKGELIVHGYKIPKEIIPSADDDYVQNHPKLRALTL